MRIGLLCELDCFDRGTFSGTLYHARVALEKAAAESRIDELRVLGWRRPAAWQALDGRWQHRLLRRLTPARKANFTDRRDLGQGLDWIVGLVASGPLDVLGGQLLAPTVHVTDATPAFLREFYNMDVPREADAREERVIGAARLGIYSSDFMARRAAQEFGEAGAGKLIAIPFGTNLDDLPEVPLLQPTTDGPEGRIELLFIGLDWERKGGSIALDAFDTLRTEGRSVRLTIVGCNPAQARGVPGIEIHPYLDKNTAHDRAVLARLFARSHFLILPTRADCTPMVIAESNAHGIPVLAADVGGVASLLVSGQNGQLMPFPATGADYAAAALTILAEPTAYRSLRQRSFDHRRARLDWDAWAKSLIEVLRHTDPAQNKG